MEYIDSKIAPKEFLAAKYEEYHALREAVARLSPNINEELDQWEARLHATDVGQLPTSDRLDIQQQRDLSVGIRERFDEIQVSLEARELDNGKLHQQLEYYDKFPPGFVPEESRKGFRPEVLAWEALADAVGERLRKEIGELYIAQTQIRLFLIDVEPQLDVDQRTAISYAHQNRLDLMNSKANVMDTFRRVEVAADALQSDLSITGTVALGSDPTIANAYRFDANNNSYTAGVEFDGPLNRLNERNTYRASQIAYQQSTRSYMADKDRIANEVRSVLRQLELSRLSFRIARQQVVAATRQFDQAQLNLRTSGQESNLTLFLLEALEGLLDAKNNLISNWASYRVQKMRLFTSLELLYLDDGAQWTNEETGLDEVSAFNFIDPEYFPPEWTSDTLNNAEIDDVKRLNEPDTPDLPTQPQQIPRPAPDLILSPAVPVVIPVQGSDALAI